MCHPVDMWCLKPGDKRNSKLQSGMRVKVASTNAEDGRDGCGGMSPNLRLELCLFPQFSDYVNNFTTNAWTGIVLLAQARQERGTGSHDRLRVRLRELTRPAESSSRHSRVSSPLHLVPHSKSGGPRKPQSGHLRNNMNHVRRRISARCSPPRLKCAR